MSKTVSSQQKPVRVGLISLGCAKNLVDAEIMLGSLLKGGVEMINDAASADALIINTCSFIDAAQEESVDAILESAQLRDAQNRNQALIVSGCLPQRFREELPKLMPEVDAFMGIDQVAQVSDIVTQAITRRNQRLSSESTRSRTRKTAPATQIKDKIQQLDKQSPVTPHHHDSAPAPKTAPVLSKQASAAAPPPLVEVHQRPTFIPDFDTPRFRLTPQHFAYVKIAEGCNHPCSFCTIPRMRGSHRSRNQDDILNEAKALIADGVKELNLISQDSTYYGLDLRPSRTGSIAAPDRFQAAAKNLSTPTLCTLLRALNELEGDFWVRLLYTHPAHWTDELIQTIAECPKVARYIDIPLQHIHQVMLERMRRETSQEYIVNLISRIRAGIPGIAIRTTFIVGFPGETEAYFNTLLEFIRDTQFERLGVFTYSKESGTRAGSMAGQVPDATKELRRELAMAEQLKVARRISESFVGKSLRVLVEQKATSKDLQKASITSWEHGLIRQTQLSKPGPGEYALARSQADAPDIDGRVYVRGRMPVGQFANVKIVGHTDYDLIAEPS